MSSGVILYVHGARDPRWAEPFERVRERMAERAPGMPVVVAYLEHATPDLAQASAALSNAGVRRIRVVPLFFGRGGHLREDFPRHLAAARALLPQVEFVVTAAAGEDDRIIDALAEFAIDASASSCRI